MRGCFLFFNPRERLPPPRAKTRSRTSSVVENAGASVDRAPRSLFSLSLSADSHVCKQLAIRYRSVPLKTREHAILPLLARPRQLGRERAEVCEGLSLFSLFSLSPAPSFLPKRGSSEKKKGGKKKHPPPARSSFGPFIFSFPCPNAESTVSPASKARKKGPRSCASLSNASQKNASPILYKIAAGASRRANSVSRISSRKDPLPLAAVLE